MIREADLNNDGVIDFQEFMKMMMNTGEGKNILNMGDEDF